MIVQNQQKIGKKIKNKVGGNTNESRFYTNEKELRTKKETIVPSEGINGYLKLSQGYNKQSKIKDIIRITLISRAKTIGTVIVKREDLEQAIAFMAQGDEILKYQAPTPYKDDLKALAQKSKLIQ